MTDDYLNGGINKFYFFYDNASNQLRAYQIEFEYLGYEKWLQRMPDFFSDNLIQNGNLLLGEHVTVYLNPDRRTMTFIPSES
jgi:hypothetical protein